MLTDAVLLLGLILLNGARLLQMADAGRTGARHALALSAEPTRFLSTVQVGITGIGVLNGAIGQGAITTVFSQASSGSRQSPRAPRGSRWGSW